LLQILKQLKPTYYKFPPTGNLLWQTLLSYPTNSPIMQELIKQDELTHLNKDNVRLVTQLNESQKLRTTLQATNKDLEIEIKKQVKSEVKVERESDRLRQTLASLEVTVEQQPAKSG